VATTTDYGDGVKVTSVGNSETATFQLLGGTYALFGASSGTWNVTLQILTADGSTYMNCAAAVTAYTTFDLPPGSYKLVAGGAMATGTMSLIRVPLRGTVG